VDEVSSAGHCPAVVKVESDNEEGEGETGAKPSTLALLNRKKAATAATAFHQRIIMELVFIFSSLLSVKY
jgi:hypothetical protein